MWPIGLHLRAYPLFIMILNSIYFAQGSGCACLKQRARQDFVWLTNVQTWLSLRTSLRWNPSPKSARRILAYKGNNPMFHHGGTEKLLVIYTQCNNRWIVRSLSTNEHWNGDADTIWRSYKLKVQSRGEEKFFICDWALNPNVWQCLTRRRTPRLLCNDLSTLH